MVGLGLLEFLGIVGLASHLIKHGSDAVNGAQVVRVDTQHILELSNSLVAELHVPIAARARNVWAGVRGGQLEAGVHRRGMEIPGRIEIFDGYAGMAVLERAYA